MDRQKNFSRYFIQEHLHRKPLHGGISNVDIEKSLIGEGVIPVLFPFRENFSLRAKISRIGYLIKTFFSIRSGSVVFFQFPMYARLHKLLVRLLLIRKNVHLICMIADIDGIRDDDAALLRSEIRQFRRFRYFIVHTPNMQDWFRREVGDVRTSLLNFYDYLTPPVITKREKSNDIAIAASLNKSPYVEQLGLLHKDHPSLKFYVYGEGITEKMKDQPNIIFKGIVEPYLLPSVIAGSFGLVWDGEKIDQREGGGGNYIPLNSPHKLSLYIFSGMPVIIHEDAGNAPLIRKFHIGITVSKLSEIPLKIEAVSGSAYQEMCFNTRALAQKMSKGEFIISAFNSIVEIIKKENS